MLKLSLVVFSLAFLSHAAHAGSSVYVGDQLSGVQISSSDGKAVQLEKKNAMTVLYWTDPHCPYSGSEVPKIGEMIKKWPDINWVLVLSYQDKSSVERWKGNQKAADWKSNVLFSVDETGDLATKFHVSSTAHFVVVNDGKWVYSGNITEGESVISAIEKKEPIKVAETLVTGCAL